MTITDPRFLGCLPLTLAQECPFPNDWSNPKNFSNDPRDPGGATMCGITQNEDIDWDHQHGLPTHPVIQITQDEGYAIYYNNYWLPYCPKLPSGLDLCFFDTRVNQGTTQATRILQIALNVPADGIWGPITQAAVQSIHNVPAVIEAFTAEREYVYRETRNFQYFGTDWERRAQEIGTAAARAGTMQTYALALHAKFVLAASKNG